VTVVWRAVVCLVAVLALLTIWRLGDRVDQLESRADLSAEVDDRMTRVIGKIVDHLEAKQAEEER
jgi:CHASE1-domain containing sensor protein